MSNADEEETLDPVPDTTGIDSKRGSVVTNEYHQQQPHMCKICRMSDELDSRALYHPCKCSGSIRYVHQQCLLDWIEHSGTDHCELCRHVYRFSPIYSPVAPRFLGIGIFVDGLFTLTRRLFVQNFRYGVIILIWAVVLPLIVSCLWNFYFNHDSFFIPTWQFLLEITPVQLFRLLIQGLMICTSKFVLHLLVMNMIYQIEDYQEHRRLRRINLRQNRRNTDGVSLTSQQQPDSNLDQRQLVHGQDAISEDSRNKEKCDNNSSEIEGNGHQPNSTHSCNIGEGLNCGLYMSGHADDLDVPPSGHHLTKGSEDIDMVAAAPIGRDHDGLNSDRHIMDSDPLMNPQVVVERRLNSERREVEQDKEMNEEEEEEDEDNNGHDWLASLFRPLGRHPLVEELNQDNQDQLDHDDTFQVLLGIRGPICMVFLHMLLVAIYISAVLGIFAFFPHVLGRIFWLLVKYLLSCPWSWLDFNWEPGRLGAMLLTPLSDALLAACTWVDSLVNNFPIAIGYTLCLGLVLASSPRRSSSALVARTLIYFALEFGICPFIVGSIIQYNLGQYVSITFDPYVAKVNDLDNYQETLPSNYLILMSGIDLVPSYLYDFYVSTCGIWVIGLGVMLIVARLLKLSCDQLYPGIFVQHLNDAPGFSIISYISSHSMPEQLLSLIKAIGLYVTFGLLLFWLPEAIAYHVVPGILPLRLPLSDSMLHMEVTFVVLRTILPLCWDMLDVMKIAMWWKVMYIGLVKAFGLGAYLRSNSRIPDGMKVPFRIRLRVTAAMMMTYICVSLSVFLLVCTPLAFGRWFVKQLLNTPLTNDITNVVVGLYVILLVPNLCLVFYRVICRAMYLPDGVPFHIFAALSLFIMGVICLPYLVGLFLNMALISPLFLFQPTLQIDHIQNIFYGLLFIHVTYAYSSMCGYRPYVGRLVERVQHEAGFEGVNILLRTLIIPISIILAVLIVLPHPFASLDQMAPSSIQPTHALSLHFFYLLELLLIIGASVLRTMFVVFAKLYDKIKDDQYLIGRQIHNFNVPLTSTVGVHN